MYRMQHVEGIEGDLRGDVLHEQHDADTGQGADQCKGSMMFQFLCYVSDHGSSHAIPDGDEGSTGQPDVQESGEAAKDLAEQAQRLKELLAKFKVMQKNNLAAWTELRTQAMTRKARKQSKRLLKASESPPDKQ